MDIDTPFRIMSMTKPVVTVAALRLAEQRKLDIDAPVEEYSPEFAEVQLLERPGGGRPVPRAPAREVTVKQLITHTSGLGYWFWNRDVLAWERAVGAAAAMSGVRAVLDAPLVVELPARPEYVSGSRGPYSTPRDYLIFQQMLLGRGTAPDGTTVVAPKSVDAMFSNQIGRLDFPAEIRTAAPEAAFGLAVGPGYKWGHGLLINTEDEPGHRRAGSGAWMGLFNTHFWVDPAAGVAGAVYTQILPFLAPEAMRMYADFETALHASL